MGWRFKKTSPVTESAFSAIFPRNFKHHDVFDEIKYNAKQKNPKRLSVRRNLILQPMECQQSKIDKKTLYGQCSLEEWWSHESQDGRLASKKLGIGGLAQKSVFEQSLIGC